MLTAAAAAATAIKCELNRRPLCMWKLCIECIAWKCARNENSERAQINNNILDASPSVYNNFPSGGICCENAWSEFSGRVSFDLHTQTKRERKKRTHIHQNHFNSSNIDVSNFVGNKKQKTVFSWFFAVFLICLFLFFYFIFSRASTVIKYLHATIAFVCNYNMGPSLKIIPHECAAHTYTVHCVCTSTPIAKFLTL